MKQIAGLFIKSIEMGTFSTYIERKVTNAISGVIKDFNCGVNLRVIKDREVATWIQKLNRRCPISPPVILPIFK